jgi:hypothetical protein
MQDAQTTVTIRLADGTTETSLIGDATASWLEKATQYREFAFRRKQRHFPGKYWSATMSAHVGYESRLELGSLQLADFEPDVTRIWSQPFLMESTQGKTKRRHTPDYLLSHSDGRLCLIDVKSVSRLSNPRVAAQFAWTRTAVESRGWEYRIDSEADPTLLNNVRFLAGYRRAFQFDPDEVFAATLLMREPTSFGDAVRLITPLAGDSYYARGLVLHLMWRQILRSDLAKPLSATTIVFPERF